MKRLHIADLFCGAGGTTTGAVRAIRDLGHEPVVVAVNHWPVAIETHSANHPEAQHYCINLDAVAPEKLVPGGRLDLLLASPECRFHSRALGGKPINDQSRASAWHVCRWAERLYVRSIIVENVPEFVEWGPLGRNGRPLKSKKGETFRAWVTALQSLGYKVEWRILNAADYGDATTRKRLFVMARRDGRSITWPDPSHAKRGHGDLFVQTREPWRSAREVIDWSLVGKSIFTRERPLSPNTMRRIEAGLRRYCRGPLAEAFVVVLRRHADARSIHDPIPTVTAGGTRIGLAQPFVCANRSHNTPKGMDEPIPAATTSTGGGMFLVQPQAFVLGQHGGSVARDVLEPLPTITTDGAVSLVEPFVAVYHGSKRKGYARKGSPVSDPLPTVTTANRFGLVEPFIVPQHGDGARSVDDPVPTVTTTSRGMRLIRPFLAAVNHGGAPRNLSVDEPLPTITAKRNQALIEPQIGAGGCRVTTTDGREYLLDVKFRMLQPHELAAAMGFPSTYLFAGTKEQRTKQIGNAVPVNLACALVRAAVS